MRKIVLVTGCRSGFGLGVTIKAAKAGAKVYAGFRDLATADNLLAQSRDLDVVPLQLDVTDSAQRQQAVETIERESGRLDGLVNNAGVALGGFLEQIEEDELRRVFDVNVFGAWGMTQACLPLMRRQGSGTVVMVSSMSGRFALPGLGAYAGSKFALEGLSEAWRHELRPFGVRIVIIEPGAYRTDIFGRNRNVCRRARDLDSPYAPYATLIDDTFRRVVDRIARDPDEVCEKIVDLLETPNPGLRHAVGPGAKPRAVMMRFLPFRAIETLFARALDRAKRH